MDMILDIFLLIIALAGPVTAFFAFKKVEKIEKRLEDLIVIICQRDEAIGDFMITQIEQSLTPVRVSLVAIRELLDANKPINSELKPNNWDSVKEAFKGPTRAIDLNERNRIK